MASLDTIFDDVIEDIPIKPPIVFLKELSNELAKKTKGLLIGEVEQTVYSNPRFRFDFYIEAPSLNNYRFHVLTLNHDLDFYPVEITGRNDKITNEQELEQALEQIFTSPEVKRVINGLLKQINAA